MQHDKLVWRRSEWDRHAVSEMLPSGSLSHSRTFRGGHTVRKSLWSLCRASHWVLSQSAPILCRSDNKAAVARAPPGASWPISRMWHQEERVYKWRDALSKAESAPSGAVDVTTGIRICYVNSWCCNMQHYRSSRVCGNRLHDLMLFSCGRRNKDVDHLCCAE